MPATLAIALRPFARMAAAYPAPVYPDGWTVAAKAGAGITVGDLRRAAAALAAPGPRTGDLVAELRALAAPAAEGLADGDRISAFCALAREAADRIERLDRVAGDLAEARARIGRLALEAVRLENEVARVNARGQERVP